MEAKDTVMTIGAIVVSLGWSESWVKEHRKGLEKLVKEQAEISIKAGMEKVVDFLDIHAGCWTSATRFVSITELQAFLKENELEVKK